MLPEAYILQWQSSSAWSRLEFVEQDLILTRILIEIFNNHLLSSALSFRGGTALHKIFLQEGFRYSEDLDFVKVKPGTLGIILSELRKVMSNIIPGRPVYESSSKISNLIYRYSAENPPSPIRKVKIEINTRDIKTFDGLRKRKIKMASDWFSGESDIITYTKEELLATKMRALYQRKKGRDLFDFWVARSLNPECKRVVNIFKKYMELENAVITRKMFSENLKRKIDSDSFKLDIKPLVKPGSKYYVQSAHDYFIQNYLTHF